MHNCKNSFNISDYYTYISASGVIVYISFSLSIGLISMYDLTSLLCILISHSRNFLYEIKEFLHDEEQFVSSFVKEPREHYDHLLFFRHTSTPSKKRLFDASVSHTVAGFVEEVI